MQHFRKPTSRDVDPAVVAAAVMSMMFDSTPHPFSRAENREFSDRTFLEKESQLKWKREEFSNSE